MTYQEFIEKLKETPRHWAKLYGEIRLDDNSLDCPLCAVANMLFETNDFHVNFNDAADTLGIPESLARKIACAADEEVFFPQDYKDENELNEMLQMRTDLLKATSIL